jgi:hypothetical protein
LNKREDRHACVKEEYDDKKGRGHIGHRLVDGKEERDQPSEEKEKGHV